MKATFKNLALAGTLMLVGASAQAAWIDSKNIDTHLSAWESTSYTHSITDNGFNPDTDVITSYQLAVNLYDDKDGKREGQEEWAFISQGAWYDGMLYFDVDGAEAGWSISGWAQLQSDGELSVILSSLLGDFYVGNSILTVNGNGNSVPEPATLGLMGLGLLGVGFAARRRKA